MPGYLGVERFKTMRHGANLTGLSDLSIAEVLEDSRAITDAYCTVPIGHSFLGGTIVNEQRKWRYPDSYASIGSRRVYPKHWPLQEVTGFRLVVGSGASAALGPEHLVIDQSRRFVEITSASIVSSSGLFGVSGWVVPFGGLEQPIAEMDYRYGASIEADDKLYPVADSDTIYQAAHGFWIVDEDTEVTVGGEVMPPTTGEDPDPIVVNYTIDEEEGRVIFTVAPTGVVRATYRHRLWGEIARAQSIIAADLLGASNLVSKGMSGLQSLQVGEIRIQRETVRQALGAGLDTTLPRAAELLQGFKYWSAA